MSAVVALDRFNKLVDEISRLYVDARRVQVQLGWQVGRRIVEEEQNGEMRGAYGAGLISRLSKSLTKKHGSGFSESNLRKMRHFYLLQPKQSVPTELDWTDYVELLPVKDEKARKYLEKRVVKEDLNSRQIRQLVRETRRGSQKESPELPPLKRPTGLKLNTFCLSPLRVKLKEAQVLIDCGFFVSWPVAKEELKNLNMAKEMSYTYAATIDRVIDGDTLLVLIEVGFGIIVRDRLRLRGINTPETKTSEGERAKKFVEKLLPAGSPVVIKSHKWKTDPHGRFVADVFYKENISAPLDIIETGTYLNQQLLDTGHAVRMEE